MKNLQKVVFWAVILVFIFSSILAYSSMSFTNPNPNTDSKPIVTPEEKQKIEDDKIAKTLGQGMEGVLRRLESPDGKKQEANYYLDVDGVTLTLIEPDTGVEIDSYLEKDVKVWGDLTQTTEDQKFFMKVKKIEAR